MDLNLIVEEAAKLLVKGEDSNWGLARLTFRYTLSIGERSSKNRDPDKVSIKEWAERVAAKSGRRFSFSTARRYKKLWAKHQDDDLNQISFYDALSELVEEESPEKLPEVVEKEKAEKLADPTNGVAARIKDGKVSLFPVTPEEEQEEEEVYHIATSKQRQVRPEAAALVEEKNLNETQIIYMDTVSRLGAVDKKLQEGRDRVEKELQITKAELERLDQYVLKHCQDEARGYLARIQENLAYFDRLFGSEQNDVSRKLRSVK